MSLYLEKSSDKVYFKDLIVLIDKNASPYCVFTTSDSFSVGDEIILYINSSEYLRFKVYRIKEFKEMNRPTYYKIIALHRSDWAWKSTLNSDDFEIGVQKDWNDGTRTVKLFVSSLDAMNLSLLGVKTSTPTTIPANAPTISEDLKCDGNTNALTTKMGTDEPYTIIFKDDNNAQLIYDSQITNELDVSGWIPFEEYEKWTDPSGTSYQSRVKYYIKEGHFTTFYYAGEKYNDGTDSGTINTLMFHREKTEVYDTYNPQISRVQITGTSASHEGRQFGSGSYSSLDFTDDLSCITFKKFISTWETGEANKVTVNFLVPDYIATDGSNNLRPSGLIFRINQGTTFPGSVISDGTLTFYVKVYKNGTYIETLTITKPSDTSVDLRPNANGDLNEWDTQYPSLDYHWDKVDEATADDDSTYVEYSSAQTGSYKTELFKVPDLDETYKEYEIDKVRVYLRIYNEATLDHYSPAIKVNGTVNYKPDNTLVCNGNYVTDYWELTQNPTLSRSWNVLDLKNVQIGLKINDNYATRLTQAYLNVNLLGSYKKYYSITNDDLWTFEFYHNETTSLSNIFIIGSIYKFEVIT